MLVVANPGTVAPAEQTSEESIIGFGVSDTRGKHRVQAELKRLQQEARLLEEEVEQVEKLEKASVACKEMFVNVDTRQDPLLPETNGPINPLWDRWFEGPGNSGSCSWILCCKTC